MNHKQAQKQFLTLNFTVMQKLNIIPKRKESQRNDIVTVLEFWGVIALALIFASLLS